MNLKYISFLIAWSFVSLITLLRLTDSVVKYNLYDKM